MLRCHFGQFDGEFDDPSVLVVRLAVESGLAKIGELATGELSIVAAQARLQRGWRFSLTVQSSNE
ncbi:MAG: hypothetical protein AB7T19_13990 [Planctomycetota bacterium]